MSQLKEQPTFILSGFIFIKEENVYGTVESLSVLADNNTEYRIVPDDVSQDLLNFGLEYVEMQYISMPQVRLGPWIQVLDFAVKNQNISEGGQSGHFDAKESIQDFRFEKYYQKLLCHKKFDESEWNYRDDYFSLSRST